MEALCNPATLQPCNPATLQPCNPATLQQRHTGAAAALLTLVCLFAVDGTALAQHLVDADATATYVELFSLSSGQSVTWETDNLSPGADTVIHVQYSNSAGSYVGPEVAFNDDFLGGPRSRVQVTNTFSSTRSYMLIVRAQTPQTTGTASIWRDRDQCVGVACFVPHHLLAPVGGTLIAANDTPTTWNISGLGIVWEPSQQPGGSESSMIMPTSATGRITTHYQIPGAGAMFRAYILYDPHTRALVFTPHIRSGTAWSEPEPGIVRFYANDYGSDLDGDGLGQQLENALQTCECHFDRPYCDPIVVNGACTRGSPAEAYPFDTDNDGLSDGDELFGVWGTSSQQDLLLPAWGANPMHKDLFLEVDQQAQFGVDAAGQRREYFEQLSDADLQEFIDYVDSRFGAGSGVVLENPDGLDGIQVHMDIGVDPPATFPPGYEAVFGDWTDSERFVWTPVGLTVEEPDGLLILIIDDDDGQHWISVVNSGQDTTVLAQALWDAMQNHTTFQTNQYTLVNDAANSRIVITPNADRQRFGTTIVTNVNGSLTSSLEDYGASDLALAVRASSDTFSPLRELYFRNAVVTTGGGQADGASFISGGDSFGSMGDGERRTFAHELGHTVGLRHWGVDDWGVSDCKPHYNSIMNYLYTFDNEVPPRWFSDIDPASWLELNQADLDESLVFVGAPGTPGAVARDEIAHLDLQPYVFLTHTLPGTNVPISVDWNRDGTVQPLASGMGVRGSISWNNNSTFNTMSGNGSGMDCRAYDRPEITRDQTIIEPQSSPDVIVAGEGSERYIYVFWSDGGNLFYEAGRIGDDLADGSCPEGTNPSNQGQCAEWLAGRRSLPLFNARQQTGLSAQYFDGRVFVAWRNGPQAPAGFADRVTVASAEIGTHGVLGQWDYEIWVDPFPGTTEPELALTVDDDEYVLMLINLWEFDPSQSGYYVSRRREAGSDQWSNGVLMSGAGVGFLRGTTSMDSVLIPGGKEIGGLLAEEQMPCVSGTAADGGVRVYCRQDGGQGAWTDVTGNLFGPYHGWILQPPGLDNCTVDTDCRDLERCHVASGNCIPTLTAKPALSFHIPRFADGTAIHEEPYSGQLVFAWQAPTAGNSVADLHISPLMSVEGLTPFSATNAGWILRDQVGNQWSTLVDGTGMAWWDGPTIGAAKAVRLRPPGSNTDSRVQLLPYADGTEPTPMRNGNDFSVMERRLCRRLIGASSDSLCKPVYAP